MVLDRIPDFERLEWDDWNRDHIAKHGVVQREVEEVFDGDVAVRETYKGRFQVVGSTRSGRILSIVAGPVPNRPGVYYPFSARPASPRERRFGEA